jgi:hypothetical protein
MTTIVFSQPNDESDKYQVYGVHESGNQFVFAVREFEAHETQNAEEYAKRLADWYRADHVERC